MSFSIPEAFEQAAQKAVARWKNDPTDELKDQIIATFRFTKDIQRSSSSWPSLDQLRKIWQEEFKDNHLPNFDFMKDDGDTY
ncbi:MAG TPA: hypothetical protein VKI65_11720 [Gemmataceae bacterium]|nr:hypothetical protein [Gemmataceae bacterium]